MGAKYLRKITNILKSASGVMYGRVTAGTGRGEELTPSQVRTLISFDESVDDRVAALLAAGTNITITYNDAANTLTIASTAGGLSGTGSVDNAALRADGTGGATLQNSAWIINDNLTASPNNTVNHACLEATGNTTNVSVSIKPKGSGAFCLSPPDGTATGGNARGANAVDLQTVRSSASAVASGAKSFLGSSSNSTASGENSAVVCAVNGTASNTQCFVGSGFSPTASGIQSFVGAGNNATASAQGAAVGAGAYCAASGTYSGVFSGEGNTASGVWAFVGCGSNNTASGSGSWISGGIHAVANLYGMRANASGRFSANGDAQSVGLQARNVTTSAVATELYLDGSSTRLAIPSGKTMSALVRVVGIKSDGSEVIKFLRDVTIKNVGGTTSLETSPVTIGTDINVSAATLDLSADNANDTLKIAVTPPAGTWRWHAIVECANEIAYGT